MHRMRIPAVSRYLEPMLTDFLSLATYAVRGPHHAVPAETISEMDRRDAKSHRNVGQQGLTLA